MLVQPLGEKRGCGGNAKGTDGRCCIVIAPVNNLPTSVFGENETRVGWAINCGVVDLVVDLAALGAFKHSCVFGSLGAVSMYAL